MKIVGVRLGTADLDAAVRFYRDLLELPTVLYGQTATITLGRTTITLTGAPDVRESNHLAFTIPSNRFADAKSWLSARVDPMSWNDGETELRLGEPWDSESVYFEGPDGILLELIARHRLANATDEPFGASHLLCVSEVGLGAPDVAATFTEMRRVFGMETFAGESPEFTTAGDQDGLLILVSTGRPWFPTTDWGASTGTVGLSIAGVSPGTVSSDAGWIVTAA
jgi:catechol-2,3-dioxygenase